MDQNNNERQGVREVSEKKGEYRKPTVKKLDVYETTAIGGCDVENLGTKTAPPEEACAFNS